MYDLFYLHVLNITDFTFVTEIYTVSLSKKPSPGNIGNRFKEKEQADKADSEMQ